MNNPGETNPFDANQEKDMNPEREKLREVGERSKQFVVISGPSGSGKTMVIKHLVENYGFVEPPFLTTRPLRPGEDEIGGVSLIQEEFTRRKAEDKIFLPARNYGNAYGYNLDIIFTIAVEGNNIVVEAPASNLVSDVSHLLPESTVIGMLPLGRQELEAQLIQRGLNNDEDRRVRLEGAETEKEQIIQASALMKISQIVPVHGVPQDTISQIDKLMEEKGFKKISK